jgi:hypothetical protein|tara:strand:- start:360 stop:734 length:375 start_codon:yes stop_codon:yes gene_type:complete
VIKLKDMLNENVWERKFGEPLPTLANAIEKHNDCGCNETTSCGCSVKEEVVTESPDEVGKAKKELQKLMKDEGKLRDRMYKIEQIILKDPTKGNQTLARSIKDSYKKNVTQFMRDVVSIVKRIK